MHTNDFQKIRQLFDDYLRMYSTRDDRLTTYFSEDFSGFTGGGDFLVKDRAEWVAITRQDFAQVKGSLRIELKDLAVQSLADTIAVATGFLNIHLPGAVDNILSRTVARLVLIFRKESSAWKIAHSSISLPDGMAHDGEVYPLQELKERNRVLEELVAERTLQLSEAKKAAEAASIVKSQFLANVSHEIRTPLNALVGFSSLARKATDPAKLDQYHDILEQSSRSLMDLVNDILDMSKIESGRMELEAKPFNLRQLIGSLEEQYRPLTELKKLEFQVTLNGNVPDWILGDLVRMRQILTNLVANSVKFTQKGMISCAVSLSEHDTNAGSHSVVRFEVRDTGIGLPEIGRHLLFQPFCQLDPSITRKFGGTGLGLAIVHNLVVMMKGNITYDSKEGVGTCFIVELPLQQTEAIQDDLGVTPITLAPSSVLIVEDNRFNRQLLEDILSSWGQQVTLADDGWQALAFLEKQHFDLVLLDIRMSGIDGIEVARRVRQQEKARSETSVPIIAITAEADTVTRIACLEAGIDEVLAKPVIPQQLAKAIAQNRRAPVKESPGKLLLNVQTCNDLGNNLERTQQYREMLLQDIDDELECLQAALERNDLNELGRAAHTLKGLCGHLANREPEALSAWLQGNAESSQPEQMRRMIEQLKVVLLKK